MIEGDRILEHLRQVQTQRALRDADPALAANVHALKAYQQSRFAHTYADLLSSDRYAAAAQFFLDELYGPTDFSERDRQFERIVPALVRLFPQDIVQTVGTLAALHALSESLDTDMARSVVDRPVTGRAYVRAWQRTGRPGDRERQIALTLTIGAALQRYVRNPLLRRSLRLMRAPARAAGLASLQGFLERGFETFAAMGNASPFLETVARRERALARALFVADEARVDAAQPGIDELLGQLP